jgi:hypothetical protein
LGIPLFLLREIVFGEISKNIRYADLQSPVIFEWNEDADQYLSLRISNKKNDSDLYAHGGGSGLTNLENLKLFPDGLIFYRKEENVLDFIQIIKFKKI